MTDSSLEIHLILHPLNAVVHVPGSKSLTNRALMIAALAAGTTKLTNALFSDDSRYFANALQTLGLQIELDEDRRQMQVSGLGGSIPADHASLFIGNAGTAARFLSAFLTLGNGEYILDGEPRMRERPIGDLVAALKQLGANLETPNNCPPVRIIARGLPGGTTTISGDVSSQFLSALLMAAPYAHGEVIINLSTPLSSKPYVDMTISIMRDFGVAVQRTGYTQFIIQPARYTPQSSYVIESDASAASYFFAAPAVCGGAVRVANISQNSIQGDMSFLNVLQKMGCHISQGLDYVQVSRAGILSGVDVDMSDIPDTAQTLAAIAPFATSPTRIRGIASARLKETDRIHATCLELSRLGVHVEEHHDGLTIHPARNLQPAFVQTYNDHRMAMAFSLIGLGFPGVTIQNPACVSKTFPDFFEVLDTLR